MTSRSASHPAPVAVLYADGSSALLEDGTGRGGTGTGLKCGQKSGRVVPKPRVSELVSERLRGGDPVVRMTSLRQCNPHQVRRDFPQRWSVYVRTNFSDLRHVQQVFGVSERTARKWWNAETGVNGGHVAVALAEHPVAAPRMLFSEV